MAAWVVLPLPWRPTSIRICGGRSGGDQPLAILAQDADQLLVGDADDRLRRGQRVEDVLAHGALAHGGDEVLGDLEVDVGFEQRAAHLAHGVVDVLLGQPPLAPEPGKGFVEAVGQGFKHCGSSVMGLKVLGCRWWVIGRLAKGIGGLRRCLRVAAWQCYCEAPSGVGL